MSTTLETSSTVCTLNTDKRNSKVMQQQDNNTEDGLSLNIMQFTDELLYNNEMNNNDNSSLDSIGNNMDKMRYESERPTSIEKIVNDVLIPPLSDSSPKFDANSDGAANGSNSSGNNSANLHSVSPPLEVSDIDLSNISPLSSSLQQHPPSAISHPYFGSLNKNVDNKSGAAVADANASVNNANNNNNNSNDNNEKMKSGIAPINISRSSSKSHRIHYSNTPNILSSEYHHNEYGHKVADIVKDDLYFLEYGHRHSRGGNGSRHHKYSQFNFHSNGSQRNGSQCIGVGVGGVSQQGNIPKQTRSHHNTPNPAAATTTSPLTPHSVHTARTTINSPHSVHSSHTPHTPHSMNHAFPRFTPYSTHNNQQSANVSTTSSQYSWNQQKSPNSINSLKEKSGDDNNEENELAVDHNNGADDDHDKNEIDVTQHAATAAAAEKEPAQETQQQLAQQQQQQQQLQQPQPPQQRQPLQPQKAQNKLLQMKSRSRSPKSSNTSSFLTSGPRLNYEEEGLSAADVEEVLSQLEIRPDTLRDSSTDFRPVFSCIRPIVCHKSNTPFYAQCSTAKLGYCTWCRQLRRGNQKQGSICLNCGERLTAKYHRWYPHLVRLEPLEKTRTKAMYIKYKPVFERFGITWHNEKQFDFVIDHYMLMKIYLSTENFNIDPLHLERTYMIGVFAGREFNTGALARKLLREGTKLAMFRADFPDYYDFLRDERAAVAEQMNLRFFQGIYKCYFHAHYTNIEGWYDPSVISRENIIETFKELCNTILAHTALAHINSTNNNGIKNNKKYSNNKKQHNHNHNHNNNKHHHHHHHHHHRSTQKRGGANNNKQKVTVNNHKNNNNNNAKHSNVNNANIITLTPHNQPIQQQMMNMIPNGMNMGIPNMFGMNAMPMNQITAMNQIQLNNLQNVEQQQQQQQQQQQPQQQQQQQQQQDTNKNNQLLAATQSMLNGISAMQPINQLSVTNMAAITPIGKVKSFQFSNPSVNGANGNNVYLPPLATTPRFTVPTPRNNGVNVNGVSGVQQYHTINLNNMSGININNASPIQIQPNGSNPPSVSMLSANNISSSLQIPTSMLKNTSTANTKKDDENNNNNNSNNNTKKDAKKERNHRSGKKENKPKKINVIKDNKNSLNAGAAPFLLNASSVISPPISPRNFNRNRFVAPPPPPQSFAFPPPPLPQTTNWLPVPPVLSATTPTNAALNVHPHQHHHHHHHHQAQQQHAINMIPNALNASHITQINMNPMTNSNLQNKDLNVVNHQNQINVSLVHNRGSPLFTPTQSPQFRPFSH